METIREAPEKRRNRNAGRGPDAGLLFLARRGIAEAQFRLGEMYRVGEGGARHDPSAAIRWFRAAAEQDHIDAQMCLAEAYYRGEGVSQDSEQAAQWFRVAAALGCVDAQLRLGVMYADEKASMYADYEAEDWLEAAAIAGHEPASCMLDALRAEQDDDRDDYGNSDRFDEDRDADDLDPTEMRIMVEQLLQRAWAGNVDAQCGVALAFRFGVGVAQDAEEATRWFRAAARQGLAAAHNNLGVMNYYGEGIPEPDHEAALRWFRAAAERGSPRARFNLAGMYYNGDGGLSPDLVKAVQFLRKASEYCAEAGNSLGVAYYSGDGIERNERVGVSWFQDAAVHGSWSAAYNLGALCAHGKGGLGSHWDRFAWLLVAAEAGYAPAASALKALDPWCTEVEQARDRAEKWLRPSAKDGLSPPLSDLGRRFLGSLEYHDDPADAVKSCWEYAMLSESYTR